MRKLWKRIRFFLKVAATNIYESVIKPLMAFALNEAKRTALEIATGVIKDIASDPGLITDAQKRAAAFERIKQRAKDAGHELKDSVINYAIEAAVNAVK